MIKFFRKIRQKILTENKFSKYLIYAIGEIILVVIGILIALQINTYHQNQTNKKETRAYIHRIVKDLKEDLNEVKETNRSHAHRSHLILKALEVFGSPNIEQIKSFDGFHELMSNYDSTQIQDYSFGSDLAFIVRYRTFEPAQIAFDELVSTGKLNFIDNDELKVEIQKHYIRVKEQSGFQRYISKYMKEYSDTIIEYDISNLNQETEYEILSRINDNQDLITSLENVINISVRTHNIFSYYENSIGKSTLKLIEKLKKHLETDE